MRWPNGCVSRDIQFRPTLRRGRPILNEVFWFEPLAVLGQITAPTLIAHGKTPSYQLRTLDRLRHCSAPSTA